MNFDKTQPKPNPLKPENPIPNTLKLEEGLKSHIKTVEVKLVQNISKHSASLCLKNKLY